MKNIRIGDFLPEGDLVDIQRFEGVPVPEIVVPVDQEAYQIIRQMAPGHSLRLDDARNFYLAVRDFLTVLPN